MSTTAPIIFSKGKPRHVCSTSMPGSFPSQRMQQAPAGAPAYAGPSAWMPCMCTTPRPWRQVWSNATGGTHGRKAGPDAPDGLARPRGSTRADLSNPRLAHHAGVIIPVHAASPGAKAPHIPAAVASRKTPLGHSSWPGSMGG
jgi:hypothetical protein